MSDFVSVFGCIGAVIGAGFVSGREVVFFFSQYGVHSWWLIAIAVFTMVALCDFLMRHGKKAAGLICGIEAKNNLVFSRILICFILIVLAGAMTSAAGEMIHLVIPLRYAYPAGLAGSLCVAWLLSKGNMKPFSVISIILTALFLVMTILAMRSSGEEPGREQLVLAVAPSVKELVKAGIFAFGYGAMNIAVSMGFMCQNGCACTVKTDRRAMGFGIGMCGLLFFSNALYLMRPEKINSAFPIVELFSAYGRGGYLLCVLLLYLAILTTLIALVQSLRSGLERTVPMKNSRVLLLFAAILLVSQFGFSGLVSRAYAPMGILCFLTVFFPLQIRIAKENKEKHY